MWNTIFLQGNDSKRCYEYETNTNRNDYIIWQKITHIFIFELIAFIISWMQTIGDKKLATQILQQLWLRSCLISILLDLTFQ